MDKTIANTSPKILLSFDIEEFDMPLEYGKEISFSDQLDISEKGTRIILAILKERETLATFFCTANFAQNRPSLIREIAEDGHEIASHGFFHSTWKDDDLLNSKLVLEEIIQSPVVGFRMPRMMPVNLQVLKKAGYLYNSSLNPTYLPGRYNHFDKPRTFFLEEGTLQIPSSVSPKFRFPLFWLSFHVLPFSVLKPVLHNTIQKDQYLNLYFHPWEFTDLRDQKFGMPSYVKHRSGIGMEQQLVKLVEWTISGRFEGLRMGHFASAKLL